MATDGDDAKRAAIVAAVASRLFATSISSDSVIGESLERATDPALKPAALGAALAAAVNDDLQANLDDDALYRHPLAAWCELEIGLSDGQRLSRRQPVTLADAAKRLSVQTGCDEARCRSHRALLVLAGEGVLRHLELERLHLLQGEALRPGEEAVVGG